MKHIDFLKVKSISQKHTLLSTYASANNIRITLLDSAGFPLYDSQKDYRKMDNHLNRKEISDSHTKPYGFVLRFSQTMDKKMLYVAVKTEDGYIRTSLYISDLSSQVNSILILLFVSYLIIFILSLIIVYFITRSLTNPIIKLTKLLSKYKDLNPEELEHLSTHYEIDMLSQVFKQMIITLKENAEKQLKLEKVRKEFIDNASHELKTPLTAIKGFIETLESGAINEPQNNKRFLTIMKKNVERMSFLVYDMLKLASISNKNEKTNTIVLQEVLKNVIDTYNLEENRNIEISLEKAPLQVNALYDELYSAFANYIDNALKYGGTGKITIILKKINKEAFFSILDQGSGIMPEYLDRLFERFYRPDKQRSTETGGTGLGLSIVKNVIEKYQGHVGVESTINQGSEFYFYLPLSSY